MTPPVDPPASTEPRHPMRVACRRTGLKPDLIRAWERRYAAIEPSRTGTNRRLYSDADIERLRLLKLAVDGGRGIRLVAGLGDEELAELVREDRSQTANPPPQVASPAQPSDDAGALVDRIVEAVRALDHETVTHALDEASVRLGRLELIDRLVVPLMERIGTMWRRGELRPVHEHLATASLRSFVGGLRPHGTVAGAPHLLITTPVGQLHELGALAAAVCAATEGWDVTYLGPDLPAEEIAAGAALRRSKVVALSLTYPPDDPGVPEEIRKVRRLLPEAVRLLVGGRAATGYAAELPRAGILLLPDLAGLRDELARIRSQTRSGAPS